MDAFSILRREIREFIYNEGWEDLRPIQRAAILRIHETNNNIILAAPTASGKTEAAFLPAINEIKENKGVKIIYISPLKALINDQFKRLTKLLEFLDIKVTSWHGEANVTNKNKLLKKPEGIILITPESLEAMLSTNPHRAKLLFGGVDFVIIDEIHSFLDSNRGIQLKSLLERINEYMDKKPRYIGMSATLNKQDYILAKNFFNNGNKTDVLLDKNKNELTATIEYFEENIKKQSFEALDKIYDYSKEESMLIFPNSRGEVERISVGLKALNEKNNTDIAYFAHHSSITKTGRLEAEIFAKESKGRLFSIVATSTLELGIDIGSVDSIVQYNAPYSISSLSQRLGRSGRNKRHSILHLIATEPFSLIQSISALNLYKKGIIDRVENIVKPYDVLAHQMISIILEKSYFKKDDFIKFINSLNTFKDIDIDEVLELLTFLINENYLEQLDKEIIVGRSTEKLLKMGEFFALFDTEVRFSVYNKDQKVGEVPMSPHIVIGENLFLSARIWKILDIDFKSSRIKVIKAKDGNPPIFTGGPGFVTDEIRLGMKEVLYDKEAISNLELNSDIVKVIEDVRALEETNKDLVFAYEGDKVALRTYLGTRLNITITLLLNLLYENDEYVLSDKYSTIYGPNIRQDIIKLTTYEVDYNILISYITKNFDKLKIYLGENKYMFLVPKELQVKYFIHNILKIDKALNILSNIDLRLY